MQLLFQYQQKLVLDTLYRSHREDTFSLIFTMFLLVSLAIFGALVFVNLFVALIVSDISHLQHSADLQKLVNTAQHIVVFESLFAYVCCCRGVSIYDVRKEICTPKFADKHYINIVDRGGRGTKNPKLSWTSYMDAPICRPMLKRRKPIRSIVRICPHRMCRCGRDSNENRIMKPDIVEGLREIIRKRNEAKEVVTLGALMRNHEKSKVVKDVLRVMT